MEIVIKVDQHGNVATSAAGLAAPSSEQQTSPIVQSGGAGRTGAIDAGPGPVAPLGKPGPGGGLAVPRAGTRASGHDAGAGPWAALGAAPLGQPPPQVGSAAQLMHQLAPGGSLSAGPAPGSRQPVPVVVEAEE